MTGGAYSADPQSILQKTQRLLCRTVFSVLLEGQFKPLSELPRTARQLSAPPWTLLFLVFAFKLSVNLA